MRVKLHFKKLLGVALASTMIVNGLVVEASEEDESNLSENEVVISFAGDCTLGGYLGQGFTNSFEDVYNHNGEDYFFSNVKEIFENDDITIVNLEGPLTDYKQTIVKKFPIKGEVKYTGILKSGSIEMVSLANNHTLDCGQVGLQQTKEVLTENNIKYAIDSDIAYYDTDTCIRIGFISMTGWSDTKELRTNIKSRIAEARENGADIVITAFHWGIEREHNSNITQQSIAHYAIDCGSDFVVGHHPHVLQGIEQYNGKTILYSLGNFSFGANKNPADKDTIIYQQTFKLSSTGEIVYGESKIVPCKISAYTDRNDYRPTPCNDEDGQVLLNKLISYR